ncbi:MAG: HNH endonuclease [Chrysiogenetes bacterium]|nr:HNH endonuclease [Chrysiogenetes bacterium]
MASRNLFPDEVRDPSGALTEGSKKSVTVNAYERSPQARQDCIAHFGAVCQVCNLDFEARYGEIGQGFIHVHHIKPLNAIGDTYQVDPVKDLVPVCPNCHAMLHRKDPPLSVQELRERLTN